MRCDCAAAPPGELIESATALALLIENARSSTLATPPSVSPGFSGVEIPMAPASRTTGTTGMSPRNRAGTILCERESARSRMEGSDINQHIGMGLFRLKLHLVNAPQASCREQGIRRRVIALLNEQVP